MKDIAAADLPALEAFAGRTTGRRDRFDGIAARTAAVRLPRDAFGYLPGIGGRIHDAYEEFVDDCQDAARQITDAISSLSQGVRGAAEGYADSDRAAVERLHPGQK